MVDRASSEKDRRNSVDISASLNKDNSFNHFCDYDMSEHGSFKSDRSHELSTYSKAEKTIVT